MDDGAKIRDPLQERRGRDVFGFSTILLRQIDRICEAGTSNLQSTDVTMSNTFCNGVLLYEKLLEGEKGKVTKKNPILDDKYKEEKKTIQGKHGSTEEVTNIEDFIEWFGLLMNKTKETKYLGRSSGEITDTSNDGDV